jgi:hypothetical protein
MPRTRWRSYCALRLTLFAACGACWVLAPLEGRLSAAEPQSKSQKAQAPAKKGAPEPEALDEALLKDLNNELLDDAGDLRDRPRTKPAEAKKSVDKSPDQPLVDGEDVGMPSAEDDPLMYISEEMRSVESLIVERAKRPHAEVLQQRIVEDLAKLIEQAESQRDAQQAAASKDKKQQTARRQGVQQPKGGSAGSKESNKPAKDSTDRLGKAENARPDPELIKGLMKNTWGHLPERAREQMLQNSPERFLPQYELLIERYYKRLAEEQNSK